MLRGVSNSYQIDGDEAERSQQLNSKTRRLQKRIVTHPLFAADRICKDHATSRKRCGRSTTVRKAKPTTERSTLARQELGLPIRGDKLTEENYEIRTGGYGANGSTTDVPSNNRLFLQATTIDQVKPANAMISETTLKKLADFRFQSRGNKTVTQSIDHAKCIFSLEHTCLITTNDKFARCTDAMPMVRPTWPSENLENNEHHRLLKSDAADHFTKVIVVQQLPTHNATHQIEMACLGNAIPHQDSRSFSSTVYGSDISDECIDALFTDPISCDNRTISLATSKDADQATADKERLKPNLNHVCVANALYSQKERDFQLTTNVRLENSDIFVRNQGKCNSSSSPLALLDGFVLAEEACKDLACILETHTTPDISNASFGSYTSTSAQLLQPEEKQEDSGSKLQLDTLHAMAPLVTVTTASPSNIQRQDIQDDDMHSPFARPRFPPPLRDRSTVTGLSSSSTLRTCFRIGEMLKEGARCAREGQDAVIELFARVTHSSREPNTTRQYFHFADAFHDRPPFANGLLQDFRVSRLVERESHVFLGPEKDCLARCLGRLHKDSQCGRWTLHILRISKSHWEEVQWTKQILDAYSDVASRKTANKTQACHHEQISIA